MKLERSASPIAVSGKVSYVAYWILREMMKFSRRLLAVFALTAALLISVVVGSPVAFAQLVNKNPLINENPIDWTVVGGKPFIGTHGDKIPLRVGQHDDSNDPRFIIDGFGERHIQDAHGVVPPPEVIDSVLHEGKCESPALGRFTCVTDEATVGFSTIVDDRSGDGLPFGIVTAFFNAPDSEIG